MRRPASTAGLAPQPHRNDLLHERLFDAPARGRRSGRRVRVKICRRGHLRCRYKAIAPLNEGFPDAAEILMFGSFHQEMRIGEIDAHERGDLPGRADRCPEPVIVRQAWRADLIADRAKFRSRCRRAWSGARSIDIRRPPRKTSRHHIEMGASRERCQRYQRRAPFN